jgi:hypothetical protein
VTVPLPLGIFLTLAAPPDAPASLDTPASLAETCAALLLCEPARKVAQLLRHTSVRAMMTTRNEVDERNVVMGDVSCTRAASRLSGESSLVAKVRAGDVETSLRRQSRANARRRLGVGIVFKTRAGGGRLQWIVVEGKCAFRGGMTDTKSNTRRRENQILGRQN